MPACITRPARCGRSSVRAATACCTTSARSHGVAHRRCGKLIVATNDAERTRLEAIHAQGIINGVEGLELIGGNAARATRAGIVLRRGAGFARDRHHRRPRLHAGAAGRSRSPWRRHRVRDAGRRRIAPVPHGWRVHVRRHASRAIRGRRGGQLRGPVGADRWRATIEGYPAARIPRQVLAKGNYFAYAGRPAFTRLIYPTPVDGGLGVHVTLDLAGRMRFGPDVRMDRERELRRRSVTRRDRSTRASAPIGRACRTARWCPIMPASARSCQARASRPRDFLIEGPAQHGMPGLVNLFGIESPGLTSFAAAGGRGRRSVVRKSMPSDLIRV